MSETTTNTTETGGQVHPMVMPCPFCGNQNIRIYFIDGDSWIKDIICTCDDCSATITTRINRQSYVRKNEKGYPAVNEDRFEADVQQLGAEAWNKRA